MKLEHYTRACFVNSILIGGEGLNACVLPTPVCISTLYYDRHAKYEILKISV